MAKKDFGKGFDLILGEGEPQQINPAKDQEIIKSNDNNLPKVPHKEIASTKITVKISNHLLGQLKSFSYWNRQTLTQTISDALKTHFDKNIDKFPQ